MPSGDVDYQAHFDAVAGRYEKIRRDPTDANMAALVAEGDLAGRRVIDVGAGTGRVAAVLTREYGCDVVAVEPSDGMIAQAEDRSDSAGFTLKRGSAEALPVAGESFERALMQMVVHLVDRSSALPELRRVLRPDGRAVISTLDTDGIDDIWLSHWFPSYPDIERARFPAVPDLLEQLREAGFRDARSASFVEPMRYSRVEALARLHGRYASSLALVPNDEYERGVERAEAELPEVVAFPLRLAIVVAEERRTT